MSGNEQESGWRESGIEAVKSAIRDETTAVEDHTQRISRILTRIDELEDDTTANGFLNRWVYVMSALVHHERYGGLSASQVRGLKEIGTSILNVQRIVPGSSRLSYLYGDLYSVLSQIERKAGNHWDASWVQQMGYRFSKPIPDKRAAYLGITTANRTLRLGHADLAIELFNDAAKKANGIRDLEQISLGKIKAMRLSGQLEAADKLANETLKQGEFGKNLLLEVEWERLCIETQASGKLDLLVGAVRSGKPHYLASYLVETFLWAHTVQSKRWMGSTPAPKTVARYTKLNPRQLGPFLKCALSIEQCYDTEIPIVHRMRTLGETLNLSRTVVTIDKELLILAAGVRFLVRSRGEYLASLLLREYQNACIKLSGGQTSDILGMMGDLKKS